MDNSLPENSAKDILSFQVRRDIVAVYKRFLTIVEDLQLDHTVMMSKILASIPAQYRDTVKAADYFTDAKFVNHRKRILDIGNEAVRGLEEQLKQFTVRFGNP